MSAWKMENGIFVWMCVIQEKGTDLKKICWLLYSLLKANGDKSLSAAFIILWISYA